MSDLPKLKVLIVAPALPLVGGQAVQAARLVEKFCDEPTVTVDLQAVNPIFLPALQKIKYVRTVLTTVRYLFDLLVRVRRYDVIHIFSASYFSFLLGPTPAVLIATLYGKRTILNYRSGEAEDHLKSSSLAVSIIRLFDLVITPSDYLVEVFAKFGLKARPIFNFVNAEEYGHGRRDTVKPVFLANRNLEPLYNVGCVIKAFSLIQKRHENASLTIAGDGSEKEKLCRLAEDLGLKNVEFVGPVPQTEMPALYAKADIYLNASNIDNMPNSVIEAFAAGTLVISTNAGGIPYVVTDGENGFLVERDDHKAMSEKAINVLENNDLAQKIIANAYTESSKYTWENVRSKWIELYRELADQE